TPVRTAIVGTGNRAQLFTEGLAKRDGYDVVALCDSNSVRMAFHNRMLPAAGRRTGDQREADDDGCDEGSEHPGHRAGNRRRVVRGVQLPVQSSASSRAGAAG